MHAQFVGTVERWFPSQRAAMLDLCGSGLRVGDHVHIVGQWDDVWLEVRHLELDHEEVEGAPRGAHVGVPLDHPVHPHAEVWKVRWPPHM
jgi:hypothetical protein